QIVFNRISHASPSEPRGSVYTIGADGRHLRLVYRAPSPWAAGGSIPRWSPDGTEILFSDWCFFGDDPQCPASTPNTGAHLFTIPPDGSGLTEIPHGSVNPAKSAWSPDGRWIVFSRYPQRLEVRADLYIMRADGTDLRRIASGSRCSCGADWSAPPSPKAC